VRADVFACLQAAALGGFRLPDLERAAEAHEHHAFAEAGIGDQRFRHEDAPFPVGFDRIGVGVQGRQEVVLRVAEYVQAVERRSKGVEDGGGPCLDAGVLVRWPQHQCRSPLAVAVAVRQRAQCRAERSRDGDAALGVQLILVGAQEMGHPARPALPRSAPVLPARKLRCACTRRRPACPLAASLLWERMG